MLLDLEPLLQIAVGVGINHPRSLLEREVGDLLDGHVFGFIGTSVPIWQSFALQSGSLAAWSDHIAQPAVRGHIDYILRHHIRLIEIFYGAPATAGLVFDTFWRFGGN